MGFNPTWTVQATCSYFQLLLLFFGFHLEEDDSFGNIQVGSTMIWCHLRYRLDYKCLRLLMDYVCVSRAPSELTFETLITEWLSLPGWIMSWEMWFLFTLLGESWVLWSLPSYNQFCLWIEMGMTLSVTARSLVFYIVWTSKDHPTFRMSMWTHLGPLRTLSLSRWSLHAV